MSSSETSTETTFKNPAIRYVILMETNGDEHESWYNFIRYDGNEKALEHLQTQLSQVDFVIMDDLSTFDLDTKHLVSMQTAREMCKVDLNPYMFHRKFDGKLEMINFKFSKNDRNKDRIRKVNKLLNRGDIENFIDTEDLCDSDYSEPSDYEEDSYSDDSDSYDRYDSHDSHSDDDSDHSHRDDSDRYESHSDSDNSDSDTDKNKKKKNKNNEKSKNAKDKNEKNKNDTNEKSKSKNDMNKNEKDKDFKTKSEMSKKDKK